MAVERRFLIASSFARLIQRESRVMSRIVEGYFPFHPERFQLVRVERERAVLILGRRQEDGSVTEERAEIPHAHAEALIDVAAGTVAFDRMVVTLGGDRRALLDRFMLPRGIDVLTTVMEEGARDELPEWFGPEVTGQPEFETSGLAINGLVHQPEVAITDRGLEALLDTLEQRSPSRRYMPRPIDPVRQPAEPQGLPPGSTSPEEPLTTWAPAPGEIQGAAEGENPPEPAAGAEAPAEAEPENVPAEAAGPAPRADEPPRPQVQSQPARGRQPRLRENVQEVDEGIARIARSLAPRGSGPLH